MDDTYTYAGGSVGGQSLYSCSLCGALLFQDGTTSHSVLHADVEALKNYNGIPQE